MALCALLYLAWWYVYFRPGLNPGRLLKVAGVVCILGAAATGIGAVCVIVTAVALLPTVVPGAAIIAGAAVLYAAALFVTAKLLARPVTTELLLIVAWLALEVSVANAFAATGAFSGLAIGGLLVATGAAAAASLACYNAYYHLKDWPSFIDGCGPLIAVGILSLAYALL